MNERMNESLSALVDGEADELEIRRLLNQSEKDDDLLSTWSRYQLIGAVMRGEAVSQLDLAKGVRQAIDGEPMDNVKSMYSSSETQPPSLWKKMATSGVVAASVMVAVVMGVQWQQAPATGVAVATTQSADPVFQVAEVVPMSAEQQAQLEDAQRKLQEYVLQHNEHATESPARAMLPFARTVNFQQGEVTKP